MRIDRREPKPRSDGDYQVDVTKGYGEPTGDIILDEDGDLRLQWLNEADCDRLIKAASAVKEQVARYRAMMVAPHGCGHVYKGTCQLCGKPEDGNPLHGEIAQDDAAATGAALAAMDREG